MPRSFLLYGECPLALWREDLVRRDLQAIHYGFQRVDSDVLLLQLNAVKGGRRDPHLPLKLSEGGVSSGGPQE